MLIILFIVFLIMIIIGAKLYKIADEKWRGNWAEWLATFSCLGTILGCICEFATVVAIIINCVNISQLKVSDKKIAMYEEENNNIQNSISEIIGNYMDYEQGTYAKSLESMDLKSLDIVVLSQLYPDLKSNEMVNTQIQIYQENNKKIKELKENKLNYEISKWWLYFGKVG